jgi:hypothetical protein
VMPEREQVRGMSAEGPPRDGHDRLGARSHVAGHGPGGEGESRIGFECVDFCPICRTADVVRATMPPEFRQHWHSWQREMLLAFRSLLDHYIAHVESEERKVVRVEDIPIQ